MSDIEEYGCAHCFAAVYRPTAEEAGAGVCTPCHRRAMDRAAQEWREFEDQHADILNQD